MKASKIQLLDAISKSKGIVSSICNNLNISRQAFYKRLENDEELATALQNVRDEILDFTESKLFDLIYEGNSHAIFFYLKTIGKHRGYVEKQEFDTFQKTVNIIEVPKLDAYEPTIEDIKQEEH
jgi:hypothetical protein